jgi:hypothetical protein
MVFESKKQKSNDIPLDFPPHEILPEIEIEKRIATLEFVISNRDGYLHPDELPKDQKDLPLKSKYIHGESNLIVYFENIAEKTTPNLKELVNQIPKQLFQASWNHSQKLLCFFCSIKNKEFKSQGIRSFVNFYIFFPNEFDFHENLPDFYNRSASSVGYMFSTEIKEPIWEISKNRLNVIFSNKMIKNPHDLWSKNRRLNSSLETTEIPFDLSKTKNWDYLLYSEYSTQVLLFLKAEDIARCFPASLFKWLEENDRYAIVEILENEGIESCWFTYHCEIMRIHLLEN